MKHIVIVGAGKIGVTICNILNSGGDYHLTVADASRQQLECADLPENTHRVELNVNDEEAMAAVLKGKFAVISAAPFHVTSRIALAAKRAAVHYLDLTEDVAMTKLVQELAVDAQTAFIPQCGLAPGFVSIIANDLARQFDTLDTISLKVGALPRFPSNALNYNLTWSTDGVINEYCEPCDAIVEGTKQKVAALADHTEISIDGETYEAFNTSGGVGTLCETFKDKVRTLNYQSLRYPGHCNIVKALLHDLRLAQRRDVFKDILENALPTTHQDVVIIFVTVSGKKNGHLTQETYANKIYGQVLSGTEYSAIQMSTAGSVCAVLDMLSAGDIAQKGFVHQEDIKLEAFLSNRYGGLYALKARKIAA